MVSSSKQLFIASEAQIAAGIITNASINAAAGITYAKLNLAASVKQSDFVATIIPSKDFANGVSLTLSGWSANPANIANATDGNDSTFAGTGTVAAAGNGLASITLADPDTVVQMCRIKVGIFVTSGGTMNVRFYTGVGGVIGNIIATTTSTTEVISTIVLSTLFMSNNAPAAVFMSMSPAAGTEYEYQTTPTTQLTLSFAAVTQVGDANIYTLEVWCLSR